MSLRSELREQVQERSGGRCEWSECRCAGEHLAHIRGLGMGGNPDLTRDVLGNVWWLCVFHHDMLDGRVRWRLREVESLALELNRLRYPVTAT